MARSSRVGTQVSLECDREGAGAGKDSGGSEMLGNLFYTHLRHTSELPIGKLCDSCGFSSRLQPKTKSKGGQ